MHKRLSMRPLLGHDRRRIMLHSKEIDSSPKQSSGATIQTEGTELKKFVLNSLLKAVCVAAGTVARVNSAEPTNQ